MAALRIILNLNIIFMVDIEAVFMISVPLGTQYSEMNDKKFAYYILFKFL